MSVSVIIPAFNEMKWLPRTIDNIFATATGHIEVIVVDQGGNCPKMYRDNLLWIGPCPNHGERKAMNAAARQVAFTHLLRIDAHCDFSPKGWDQMMEEVTGPTDLTQAKLTAVSKEWKRLPGHHYERCRLHANMEAKWEKPNRDHSTEILIPNMSSTGCGFMIRSDFYWKIGGANENYPKMGAIGEEFSVKTWLNGGKVQTRTDVIIGHIFDTGGYDTGGVIEARKRLCEDFGDRYDEIYRKFPDLDWSADLRPTAVHHKKVEGVTVRRTDETKTKNIADQVVRIKYEYFEYHWVPTEHPGEEKWTEEQVCEKYAALGYVKVGERIVVRNDDGQMIDAETGELEYTLIPPEHYEIPAEDPESRQVLDKGEQDHARAID